MGVMDVSRANSKKTRVTRKLPEIRFNRLDQLIDRAYGRRTRLQLRRLTEGVSLQGERLDDFAFSCGSCLEECNKWRPFRSISIMSKLSAG